MASSSPPRRFCLKVIPRKGRISLGPEARPSEAFLAVVTIAGVSPSVPRQRFLWESQRRESGAFFSSGFWRAWPSSWASARRRGEALGKDDVANVPVVTQDGRTLRFYDDLIKGKIVVLSFIYTSCKDICPLSTARLGEAQERLGSRIGRDIFFYSISIEPERDTPERLKQYADAFHAGPGWLFLTGLPEDIQQIRYKFGDRRPDLADHRNDVVLGNGTTGEWQRENELGDIEHFVRAIEDMDPAARSPTAKLAAAKDGAPGPSAAARPTTVPYDRGHVMEGRQAGSAMFAKLCAGCHTVGRGDHVGPDLDGLTLRRSRAWITEFLINPIKMRARKDPIALALAAKFPGARMPYLQIHDSDAADLISISMPTRASSSRRS